ncbi:MAG: RecQ family zinc-binding domain-containing protein [Xenococcus sp. MO_188.B8]|nr:RecQ family zinc-binding domain-containing protein [Xenococcus sp. MO_188.B8]
MLHSLDRLSWQDPFHYKKKSTATSFGNWQAKQKHWQKQMQQFLHAKQCRWQFLLTAFGLSEESLGFQCGKCDQCRKIDRGQPTIS